MYILGISCWYHDAAAALLKDGAIVACSEEERFSRIKHDSGFPVNAINFCLGKAGIAHQDLDFVVFYEKPILKFERILSSVLENVPFSSGLFREAAPLWFSEKLKFRKKVKKLLKTEDEKILFCTHHLAHAASSFFVSPFDEAAVLTVDGVGERATAAIGRGKGGKIKMLEELNFPDSVGLLYSAFTAFLGFKVNEGEYKVMGMAAYGEPKYVDRVRETAEISDDGSVKLNMKYFSFPYSVEKTFSSRFVQLFGEPRAPESSFFTRKFNFPAYYGEKPADYFREIEKNQYFADVAASIQAVTEEILVAMAKRARRKTGGMKNLCFGGGVALNSRANYRILKESGFEDIYIQPAATDAGGALGAALWLWTTVLGGQRNQVMSHAYWGEEFAEGDVVSALKENNLKYEELPDGKIYERIADCLISGKVAGWFQGRAEWGPRALGNRSILADARNAQMKEIVNLKVKFREPFRPFAPSVLAEEAYKYFDVGAYPDRFMLMTHKVHEKKRDKIPAVTHTDGSSRPQTVYRETNRRYWELIDTFRQASGEGLVLNTSFNLRGEPIVNSPRDAVKTFLSSGIDILVLENYIAYKE